MTGLDLLESHFVFGHEVKMKTGHCVHILVL